MNKKFIVSIVGLVGLNLTSCVAYDGYGVTSANTVAYYRTTQVRYPGPPQTYPRSFYNEYNQPVREGRDWIVSESVPMDIRFVYPHLNPCPPERFYYAR